MKYARASQCFLGKGWHKGVGALLGAINVGIDTLVPAAGASERRKKRI